jgi:formylglycine-generating enzyme required for sulfatase activity
VKLDKVFALKVLSANRMQDPEAVARFEREMKTAGKLEHVNIIRASDADEIDGTHFLVMEYVHGLDLSEIVQRIGPLSIADACEIVRQAALGLQHAHEHGLVHRDIKPSNLMLTEDGTVKILDLGLALLAQQQGGPGRELTATGQMMGTLDYMAPEQGDDSHQVDIRADIYSLGATLYKLLSGRAPFAGDKHQTLRAKLTALVTEDPQSLDSLRPEFPADLVALVHRMLSKDAADRPGIPDEIAEALSQLCERSDLAALLAKSTRRSSRKETERWPGSTFPDVSSSAMDTTSNGRIELGGSEGNDDAVGRKPAIAGRKAGGFRIGWKVLTVSAGLAAVVLPAVLLSFRTPYGTVSVEAEEEDIQVVVKQDGKEIDVIDADSHWSIELQEGNYEIELRGGNDRLQLDKDTVTVTRRDKIVVRVKLRREETVFGPDPPPLASAPFDEAQAKQHQRAWAEYLGMSVERDFELPGGVKLTMVLIPPGEFVMGSTDAEQEWSLEAAKAANDRVGANRICSEGPQHRVRITKPFYVGKHEVTQRQWEAVMGINPSKFKGDPSRPVENVSWEDIPPFLSKLNESRENRAVRFVLPTEARWEYACRAGTTTFWHCGDSEASLQDYGWFDVNSRNQTHSVGRLQPNAWGLYDLHGNVWEWCADWYDASYYQKSPVNDPCGPTTGWLRARVLRGGSWNLYTSLSRSAHRLHWVPHHRGGGIGLRLAGEVMETRKPWAKF